MDALVGQQARLGIVSIGDLGAYYQQFLIITKFLIRNNKLSENEQPCAFRQGFQESLWLQVLQCLQMRHPDHDQDDPYPIAEIFKAAEYVLHGTTNVSHDYHTAEEC